MTLSHTPCGRLPLLSVRPAVTFPPEERRRPSALTKLYCLVTEAHGCEQLAQGCYPIAPRPGIEFTTSEAQVERFNHYTTESPDMEVTVYRPTIPHNQHHLLYNHLPPPSTASQNYNLQTPSHNRQLPDHSGHLTELLNFFTRLLYNDIY